jgi:hypothetical protein
MAPIVVLEACSLKHACFSRELVYSHRKKMTTLLPKAIVGSSPGKKGLTYLTLKLEKGTLPVFLSPPFASLFDTGCVVSYFLCSAFLHGKWW